VGEGRRMRKMVGWLGGLAVGGLFFAGAAVLIWVYVVQNVEQPSYRVVQADGKIEVRDYPSLVVAEVVRRGDRKSAVNAGFRPLASYIFGKDRAGDTISMTAPVTQSAEKIAMTAPVTQSASAGDGQTWTVRFIMPSKYTLADLPKPGSGDVTLKNVPAARRAAIRFSGVADDASIAAAEAALRRWLTARGMKADGAATYAYYNDPFTPGPLRRNEVLIEVDGG
ncbi:MAG: SOUL family heme-binding protein, partial [Hyphomicrobiaceae bacterium]